VIGVIALETEAVIQHARAFAPRSKAGRRGFAAFRRVGLRLSLRMTLAAAMAAMAIPSPASSPDFYHGKTLTIVVGLAPGGGFDANARLLARHLGRYIPGTPDVIVVNAPGASSATSLRRLDVNLPTDGTVIDAFNFGLIDISLLQPGNTRIDFRHYAWIGSISEDVTTCYVWRRDGPKTIAEMKAGGHYFFGSPGFGASQDINTKILRRVFGVDITQAYGYAGSADVRLAIERGELDGDCGSWSSVPEDWTKSPKFHPVLRTAARVPDGMSPELPYVIDAAPDEAARTVIRFLVADGDLGRPFVGSGAIPADRVRLLRAAFAATVKDRDFMAEAKALRLPVSPRTGTEAAETVEQLYATPPDIVAAARKIVAE
jgi:tripartite-type tricarboxylate transporter receptor subunit TctC